MPEEGDRQTHRIIGAAIEVHRNLGPGFLEAVYQSALAREFDLNGVPYVQQEKIPIYYKGHSLGLRYRADFVCFDEVVVELKAVQRLGSIEEAQVIHYLKAGKLPRGLLLNFGAASLQVRRFVGPSFVESVQSVKSVVPNE